MTDCISLEHVVSELDNVQKQVSLTLGYDRFVMCRLRHTKDTELRSYHSVAGLVGQLSTVAAAAMSVSSWRYSCFP